MAGSRGTKCSWIEMQRLAKDVLPAVERGEGKLYAGLRCVQPNTVSSWKRSAQVLSVMEDADMQISAFEHFQPSHATHIAQAFKSLEPWDATTTDAILECIDKCEDEKLTAKQIKEHAKGIVWSLKGEKRRKRRKKLPTGRYAVNYCDPPWQYDFSETDSREIENQYPTMTVDELVASEFVKDLPFADRAVMFMWATAPKLIEALTVLEAWGFEYKTNAVWDKGKIGMGYWFRGQHELLLVGTRKDFPPPEQSARVSSVIEAVRGKHSQKPAKVYSIIEKYFPDERGAWCELFQRETRKDWIGWGNEN